MRTGKDLILATKPYASEWPAKSWYYALSTAVLLLMSMAGTLFITEPVPRFVSSVLMGLLTLRFFVIYHDQQHHAILAHSRIAEFLMRLFGMYALSASSVWRSSHNHHHNHNSRLRGSHIGSFPIMTADHFERQTKMNKFAYLFSRSTFLIFFGYFFVFIIGMCITPFRKHPKKHFDCLLSLILHLTITAALWTFLGWQGVVFCQLIPSMITFSIGSYLFYAQHNFPAVTFSHKAGWTYEKAALESSSYMKTGPVAAWFMANIGYHHIHHLNSKIPFYRLPEAMAGIPELQNPRTTTINPVEIFRCLRLKVWDTETQKLVPLSQRSTPARANKVSEEIHA